MVSVNSSRIACLLWLSLLVGCPNRNTPSPVPSQAAKDKIAAIAGETPGESSSEGQANLADSPQGSDARSVHPIDQVPEGARYREAARAIDRGDMETAEKIRQELTTSSQFKVLAEAVSALMLVKQGKNEEAISIAESISAVPVMQAEAYVIAGEVFHRQNRLLEAIAAFENVLAINADHVRANRWLGAAYYDTGSMRLATKHLRKTSELDASDVNSLLLSAKINQEYEQYEEAVIDYRNVLERELKPELKVFARVKLAECLCVLRKLDEARLALSDCPPAPAVLAARALIAESEGQFEAATKFALDALEVSPHQPVATMVLGRIYVTEKHWSEAEKVLKPFVDANAFDHESRLLLGRALIGAGDKERGQSEVKRATELKDNVLKFANLHLTAMEKPEDANVRFQLGEMAEKLGKPNLARSWYSTALGMDPSLKGAESALARLKPSN